MASDSFSSSWFGLDTYFGYFVDWSTQVSASVLVYPLILSTIGSFFVGISLYVEGMVQNLKETLMAFDGRDDVQPEKWSIYAKEIQFHSKIIK